MPNPHFCPICGKGKGGNSHAACSKILQQQHQVKRRKTVKRLNEGHVNFLTRIK